MAERNLQSQDCTDLGPGRGYSVTVACPEIEGYSHAAPVHTCLSAASGARACIPDWPGPWKLPERETDAAAIALCRRCEHYSSGVN